MKELVEFIKWQFRRFEFWQICFIISMILSLSSIAIPDPYGLWMNLAGMAIIFAFFAKWAIWDGTKNAWHRYKTEKEKLFDTIKHS